MVALSLCLVRFMRREMDRIEASKSSSNNVPLCALSREKGGQGRSVMCDCEVNGELVREVSIDLPPLARRVTRAHSTRDA